MTELRRSSRVRQSGKHSPTYYEPVSEKIGLFSNPNVRPRKWEPARVSAGYFVVKKWVPRDQQHLTADLHGGLTDPKEIAAAKLKRASSKAFTRSKTRGGARSGVRLSSTRRASISENSFGAGAGEGDETGGAEAEAEAEAGAGARAGTGAGATISPASSLPPPPPYQSPHSPTAGSPSSPPTSGSTPPTAATDAGQMPLSKDMAMSAVASADGGDGGTEGAGLGAPSSASGSSSSAGSGGGGGGGGSTGSGVGGSGASPSPRNHADPGPRSEASSCPGGGANPGADVGASAVPGGCSGAGAGAGASAGHRAGGACTGADAGCGDGLGEKRQSPAMEQSPDERGGFPPPRQSRRISYEAPQATAAGKGPAQSPPPSTGGWYASWEGSRSGAARAGACPPQRQGQAQSQPLEQQGKHDEAKAAAGRPDGGAGRGGVWGAEVGKQATVAVEPWGYSR